MLVSSAAAVGVAAFLFDRIRRASANLAAADTAASAAVFFEAFLRHLSDVSVNRAGDNQFCRDIALNALEADVLRKPGLCVCQEVDEFVFVVGLVLALFPEFFEFCARGD